MRVGTGPERRFAEGGLHYTAIPMDDSVLQRDEPDLDSYLKLFAPYEAQLADFRGRERAHGGRFALLFRQVARLLVHDNGFNRGMPKMFGSVARRYLDREPDTVLHFSYEDNRHFYLSDLRDWLALHERGRALRRANRAER
jgi:hypothetical protein